MSRWSDAFRAAATRDTTDTSDTTPTRTHHPPASLHIVDCVPCVEVSKDASGGGHGVRRYRGASSLTAAVMVAS